MPGPLQASGISRKKEGHGTKPIQAGLINSGELKQKDAVISVGQNMNFASFTPLPDSAQIVANQSIEGSTISTISNVPVLSAVSNSSKTSMTEKSHVVVGVVTSIQSESSGKQPVFDLMVDEQHEYFAGGLLVHNCLDPTRYILAARGRLY